MYVMPPEAVVFVEAIAHTLLDTHMLLRARPIPTMHPEHGAIKPFVFGS